MTFETTSGLMQLFLSRNDVYAIQKPDGTYERIKNEVNSKLVDMHLQGVLTVGLYQLDKNDLVKWICWDIDDRQGCKEIADRIVEHLKVKYGYNAYIEASGSVNSLHVWLFLNPVPAKDARVFGSKVLTDLSLTNIEVFPKQDSIGQDGYGNLVKLPLGIHRKNGNRSSFLTPLDDVKVHDLPIVSDYENKQASAAQGDLELEEVLPKLRSCMQRAYTEKWNLHGIKGEGQSFRFAVASEMIAVNASNEAIHAYFSMQSDYKKGTTEAQIEHIRRKGYTPTGCGKLQKKCKTLLEGICENCLEDVEKKVKDSQASTLIKFVESSELELFCDETHNPYARIKIDRHYNIVSVKSKDFRRWITRLYYQNTATAPGNDAVLSALNVIEAKATIDGKQYTLHNRVCWLDGAIWYDLGNWEAIKITSQGWEIIRNPPILFKRYKHQKAQTLDPGLIPKRTYGGVTKVMDFLNITNEQERLLFVVYLVSCFVPDIPHPIPVLYGDKGAAKSTVFKVVKELLDPSTLKLATFPKDTTELIQKLSHHYFIGFDNIMRLSDWQSDALCRACTGEGFSKRELYTDDEDVIYSFQRCVGLNGINVVATKADLLDRSILLWLERIPRDQRKTERELWQRFDTVKGEILQGIFATISKAMALYPTIQLDELPRMADFAIWGVAIAEALGWTQKDFLDAYDQNLRTQNREAIEAAPVGEVILEFMDDKQEWKGRPSELLNELESLGEAMKINVKGKGFPKAAHALTKKLNEIKTNLLDEGIIFEINRTSNYRTINIRKRSVISVIASRPATGDSKNYDATNDASKNEASYKASQESNDASDDSRKEKRHREASYEKQERETKHDACDANDALFRTFLGGVDENTPNNSIPPDLHPTIIQSNILEHKTPQYSDLSYDLREYQHIYEKEHGSVNSSNFDIFCSEFKELYQPENMTLSGIKGIAAKLLKITQISPEISP